jgi:hypothetical protein
MSIHCLVTQQVTQPVSKHQPVNKIPRRRDDVTQQYWNTVPMQHAAMTAHAPGVGEYHVTFAFPRVT